MGFETHLNYWVAILLMMCGLYMIVAQGNLVKKLVGLNVFSTSVFVLFISMSKVSGGTAPIFSLEMVEALARGEAQSIPLFSNPLPSVLILTAIVVGVATTAVGLALVLRIKEAYGTIEEDEIYQQDGEP